MMLKIGLALFGTKFHRLGSALTCILELEFTILIIWHLLLFIRKGCVNKLLDYGKTYRNLALLFYK